MPTFTQALLLGSDRLTAAPAVPHAALADAWAQLDWTGARDRALLEAAALVGTARLAAAPAGGPLPAPSVAPEETQPPVPPAAVVVLRRLLAEDARALLPEWLERCAERACVAPPFFLRTLFEIVRTAGDRALLLRVIGERGRWLARQNPAWAWVRSAEPAPGDEIWETGSEAERLACLRHVRAADAARGRTLVERTWSDDPPDFRAEVLETLRVGLSLADEPFLTRALTDRRKDIRTAAQALLATQLDSAFAQRMLARAEPLLSVQRGFIAKRVEIALPPAFDPAWKADGIDEKPPAGVGEKAFWTQQILGLVPLRHWTQKLGLDVAALVALAAKSGDWAELLLGAWYRAALLHREAGVASALLAPLAAHPKALPAGTNPATAAEALLAACGDAERWFLAGGDAALAWSSLENLTGTPSMAQGRALLEQLAPALRDGFNPGGSPVAVLAARRIPPALRDEAARLLARDHGLSKPADAFMQALDLRAAIHAAFA